MKTITKKFLIMLVITLVTGSLMGCTNAENNKDNTNAFVEQEETAPTDETSTTEDVGKETQPVDAEEPNNTETEQEKPKTNRVPEEKLRKGNGIPGALQAQIKEKYGDLETAEEIVVYLDETIDLTEILQAKNAKRIVLMEDIKRDSELIEPIDLSSLTNLENLRMDHFKTLYSLEQLNLPTSIKTLDINSAYNLENFEGLEKLVNLEELIITFPYTIESPELPNLKGLTKLKKVIINGTNHAKTITEEFKESIVQNKQLKDLTLNGLQYSDLSFLNELTSLKTLEISFTDRADFDWLDEINLRLDGIFLDAREAEDITGLKHARAASVIVQNPLLADFSTLESAPHGLQLHGQIGKPETLKNINSPILVLQNTTKDAIKYAAQNGKIDILIINQSKDIKDLSFLTNTKINQLILTDTEIDLRTIPSSIMQLTVRRPTEEQKQQFVDCKVQFKEMQ